MDHSSTLRVALEEAVNADFYEFSYGPVPAGVSAAEHYATVGWLQGYDPNPWFSTSSYLEDYPEARDFGPPLFHYLEVGHVNGCLTRSSARAAAFYSRSARSSPRRRAPVTRPRAPRPNRQTSVLPTFLGGEDSEVVLPSDLFDPVLYSQRAAAAGLSLRPGESLFSHWLREGVQRRIVPTHRFHEEYYRVFNADIGQTDLWGFMHYVRHGASEGRRPTPWFDPVWYAGQSLNAFAVADSYAHFLTVGAAQGLAPCAALHDYLERHNASLTLRSYDEVLAATEPHSRVFTGANADVFAALFMPEWHTREPARDALERLATYLRDGIKRGDSPGPLFDESTYVRRLKEANLALPGEGDSPVLNWLASGIASRIVPTVRFDESYYRQKYADIRDSAQWGFAHFLMHGAYEGRSATADRALLKRVYIEHADGTRLLPPCYRRWLLQDAGETELPEATRAEDTLAAAAEARVEELFESELFREIVAQARAIEPSLLGPEDIDEIWLPPVSEALSIVHRDVHARFPRENYDTILCVPWMRMGGADLVAAFLASALVRIRPNETLLVLRTDKPDFDFSERLPREADVVDISDIHNELAPPSAERLLQAVFFGLAPKRIINVNSGLCWNTMRRFGKRLAPSMDLYACLFCYDILPSGARTGYATAEYFAETFEALTGVFTDTQYFKNELQRTFLVPETLQEKIVPLSIPVQCESRTRSEISNGARESGRPRVLWAGRFDRQKRFDLVLEIAALMPDVEFDCWGKAVLDSPPDFSNLPPNVTLHEPYASLLELPLNEADAWLFTSAWEGLPNILLEVATLGLPIVASDVGGVGELIREETGWPIDSHAPAETYERALRDVLSRPSEGARRAERLQGIVAREHSVGQFDRTLEETLKHD